MWAPEGRGEGRAHPPSSPLQPPPGAGSAASPWWQDEEPEGFQTLERVLDAIFILDVVLQALSPARAAHAIPPPCSTGPPRWCTLRGLLAAKPAPPLMITAPVPLAVLPRVHAARLPGA